jgi:hypothetical protein
MEIRAVDNFLPDDKFVEVIRYCKSSTYLYGEVDEMENVGNETFCVGMVHQMSPLHDFEKEYAEIENKNKIIDLFTEECKTQFPEIEDYILTRMYVNCFAPCENPYFHIDSALPDLKSYTCLFYANDKWNLDDGGETQFYVNNILYGVPPEPNRMVLFDGRIKHRATSFRNRHRFTIALKYDIPFDCDNSETGPETCA